MLVHNICNIGDDYPYYIHWFISEMYLIFQIYSNVCLFNNLHSDSETLAGKFSYLQPALYYTNKHQHIYVSYILQMQILSHG